MNKKNEENRINLCLEIESTKIFPTIFFLFIHKNLGKGEQYQLLNLNMFWFQDLDYRFYILKQKNLSLLTSALLSVRTNIFPNFLSVTVNPHPLPRFYHQHLTVTTTLKVGKIVM